MKPGRGGAGISNEEVGMSSHSKSIGKAMGINASGEMWAHKHNRLMVIISPTKY